VHGAALLIYYSVAGESHFHVLFIYSTHWHRGVLIMHFRFLPSHYVQVLDYRWPSVVGDDGWFVDNLIY
jgi:hypothetical protein